MLRCLAALAACAAVAAPAASAAWLPPLPLSAIDRDASSPAVALGADGRMFAAWARSDGAHSRVEAALRPAGGVLELPQIVSQAGVDASQPQLGLDGQGNAILMWTRGGELQWTVRAAGASAFGDLRTVPVPAGENVNAYRLAVAPNGAAAALVLTEDHTMSASVRLRAFVRGPGGDFAADGVFESFGTNSMSELYSVNPIDLDAGPDGGFYATWTLRHDHIASSSFTDTSVKVARRPPGAPTFESPEEVVSGHVTTGGPTEGSVGAAHGDVGPDGTMYVIYAGEIRTDPPQSALVLRSRPPDGNFNSTPSEIVVPFETVGPSETDFDMNDAGASLVVWGRGSGSDQAIRACIRPVGGPCGETKTLATGIVSAPIAAIGAGGDALAAWARTSENTGEASFARRSEVFGAAHGLGPKTTLAPPGVDVDPLGHGVLATTRFAATASVTEATVEDSVPPSIEPLAAPPGGGQGEVLAFGGGVFDVWGTVTSSWDFGDGSTGPGPSATHAYTNPGGFTAALTATDAAGNSATRSAGVTVADTERPRILSFAMTHRLFAVGAKPTPLSGAHRRVPLGTTFRFRLSEAASARIAIQRKRGRSWKTVRTLQRKAGAGATRVPFSGRLRRKALGPGRYRAVLVAADAAKHRSKPRRVGFRVVRR